MSDVVQATHARLQAGYAQEPNPSADVREDRLTRLEKVLVKNTESIVAAVDADFGGRSRHETLVADVLTVLDSTRTARRHVRAWMRPESVAPHPFFRPSRAWIEPLPLGVVGIISPWNYPVDLALGPLAGVLAAGNRALLKPSELTPRTSALLAQLVADAFTVDEVAVVEGGADVARAVTELPLDHLVFTGSTHVGRLVAGAAAPNLVPTTLELGGKSPVLIHPEYPVATAADRVAIGKLFNAGQTCIAPDYVLLPRGKETVFLEAFREAVARRWGDFSQYTSVASDRGLARLDALVASAAAAGARVERVGEPKGGRRFAPTLVFDLPPDHALLQEEIFGPILPVVVYDRVEDALAFVRARPRPLAFYVFDEDTGRAEQLLAGVVSGGAVINDTLIHFAQENLPFGGVGASGTGAYHGRAGFDRFSHRRGVVAASSYSAAWRVVAPPWGAVLERSVQALLGRLGRFI